jgi:hypothetical protein
LIPIGHSLDDLKGQIIKKMVFNFYKKNEKPKRKEKFYIIEDCIRDKDVETVQKINHEFREKY